MGAHSKLHRKVVMISLLAAVLLTASLALAQNAPVVGSGNTFTADPPVARPPGKPCVVQLFSDFTFADFSIKTFTYTPPSGCPGPWEKVIFTADFNETTGVQYDRTAQISLGYVNLYFGTTPEPTPTLAPVWHAERDVTDYSALFETAQNGEANLGNLVNSTYTGIIYGSATLEFYSAHDGRYGNQIASDAQKTADAVYPLPNASGGAKALFLPTDQLTETFTLPTNVERAYLDVVAQNQSNDEFFYTCVPNDVASELQSCGNTAFREVDVSVDGQPAGVAPAYPWIFTGGIDPSLWAPIPGVQTLNFIPYRIDLTPFAGLLSNGQAHSVALSVFNVDSYFQATATLLVFLDHGTKQITGGLTANTIGGPSPVVTENLTTDSSGDITGSVTVTSERQFELDGYVNTSHGRVDTKVQQKLNYSNVQNFTINATSYIQDITQATDVESKTTTKSGFLTSETSQSFHDPFTLDISELVAADGSVSVQTTVNQGYKRESFSPYSFSSVDNTVNSTDTSNYDSSFNFLGNSGQASSQTYIGKNGFGPEYSCTLTAANNVLTDVSQGCAK